MIKKLTPTGTDVKGKDNYNTSSSVWRGGKGSITRPTDYQKYSANWDAIFSKKTQEQIK